MAHRTKLFHSETDSLPRGIGSFKGLPLQRCLFSSKHCRQAWTFGEDAEMDKEQRLSEENDLPPGLGHSQLLTSSHSSTNLSTSLVKDLKSSPLTSLRASADKAPGIWCQSLWECCSIRLKAQRPPVPLPTGTPLPPRAWHSSFIALHSN